MTDLNGRSATILNAFVSSALSLGVFDHVNAFQPTNIPASAGVFCDIWLDLGFLTPMRSGLDITSGASVYAARLSINETHDPPEERDTLLLNALDKYIDSLHTNLTLGDIPSSLDLFGMGGGPKVQWQAGYYDQDSNKYRAIYITLPVIIDDIWSQR